MFLSETDFILEVVTKWIVEVIACFYLRQILSWRFSPNGQLRTMFLPEADLILEVVTKWTVEDNVFT